MKYKLWQGAIATFLAAILFVWLMSAFPDCQGFGCSITLTIAIFAVLVAAQALLICLLGVSIVRAIRHFRDPLKIPALRDMVIVLALALLLPAWFVLINLFP